ncbi:zinc-binding alcohol dehydrogenase [uncultured Rhodoblastus sp.]|uniref:zinc-dependent alcohol dehydrogenase n=1 Tax=uncultured Rhodoblastus sp. TaxID=543037 RepID=UPI0025D80982|nr:zinc-binding alcohol dehydrogenase [uncultured Rhodoblastus sp.]
MSVEKLSDQFGMMSARALWFEAPRFAGLRETPLQPPGEGEARVAALWSAVSRGTERLVFEGRVPVSQAEIMRAPFQQGDFSFPVKYGYCLVGRVEAGPSDWLKKTVFCLHPHQDRFNLSVDSLRPVPQEIPPRRATLAANMETALNALWDSGAGPGDRIVVIGAGVLGLLTAALAAGLPGAEVMVVDRQRARKEVAESLGAEFCLSDSFAEKAGVEADIVFHASASSAGLALALGCAGLEAKIVELSWYGDAPVSVPLGGAFHSKRLRLVSSQVGQVSPSRRPRWSFARRLDKALQLLADPRFDALITEEIAFPDFPNQAARVFAADAPGLATVLRY